MNHSKYFSALDVAFKGKDFSAAVEAGIKVAKRMGYSPKRSTIAIYYWRYHKQGSVNKYGTWRNNPKKSRWLSDIANKGKHKHGKKGKPAKAAKAKKRVSPAVRKSRIRKAHSDELVRQSREADAKMKASESAPAQAVN
jgi:hypothetical protein